MKSLSLIIKSQVFASLLGLAATPVAWSVESLTDEDMGEIAAQSGLTLTLNKSTGVTASQFAWQDVNTTGSALVAKQLQFNTVSLSNLGVTLDLDVGSGTGTYLNVPYLSMHAAIAPFLLTIGSFCPGNSGSTTACTSTNSFGELALRTNNTTDLVFYNTRGFLDGTSSGAVGSGKFTFSLANAEYYMGHSLNSQRDLIIMRNLYLRGSMTGQFKMDATNGLTVTGDLSLPKVGAINGLNLDLAVNSNVAAGTFTTTGATNLLHFGMSGTMNNVDWRMVGGYSQDVLTGTVAADSGLKMSMTTNLKTSDFVFEIGEGAASGHSVIFKNFVSFINGAAASPSDGYADFGKLYVNVVPANTSMSDFRTGFGSITQAVDTLGIAVRDLELVDYPKAVEIYDYVAATSTTINPSGTLMLPLYDLDANLELMPGGHPSVATKRGIGFNLKLAFSGSNAGCVGTTCTGDKVTALLLADTSAGVGEYIGLRNVDGFITWQQGQFYATDVATDGVSGLRITSGSNVQINLAGQFALDFLPDGTAAKKIKTTGHLFGLALQLQSAGATLTVTPAPAGNAYLSITGALNLQAGTNSGVNLCNGTAAGTGTCFTITEPADGSQVQLASISGKVNLTDSRIDLGVESVASVGLGGTFQRPYVSFSNVFQFDPGTTSADVVKIGAVNFIGGSTPTSYKLGEIVIPGGELYSQVVLKTR